MVAKHTFPGQNGTGFTLLELLVVLAIAGILMSIVPPLVSAVVPTTEVRAAVRELALTLRDARSQAISHNTAVNVAFDLDPPVYTVEDGPDHRLPDGVSMIVGNDGSELFGTSLTNFDRATEDSYRLTFYPDGSSSGVTLVLGDDDRKYVLTVGWLLGTLAVSKVQASAR